MAIRPGNADHPYQLQGDAEAWRALESDWRETESQLGPEEVQGPGGGDSRSDRGERGIKSASIEELDTSAGGASPVDFRALVRELRKAGKPTAAQLVEFMSTRDEALFLDIAEQVRGSSEARDNTIRANVARTNTYLAAMGVRLSFFRREREYIERSRHNDELEISEMSEMCTRSNSGVTLA